MSFQTDTPIHRHLAELFSHQKAVVFCGAGVSLEPPAGLPDWHKLRDYTLEAVASKEPVLQQYLSLLTSLDMMAQPGKKGLNPEHVASEILASCKGYFECFRALEQGEPNANHCYLARMAKVGYLKYIITTNFDLFIEQAMQKEGVSYRVYRTEQEFEAFSTTTDHTVHIFKLHGCISEPTTITATVEQEGKGLSPAKQKVLVALLKQYSFVFWGYSGADLKLDLDYLKMVSIKDQSPGFVWNFLQRGDWLENINPHVTQLKELYGQRAYIVHGKLPEIFDLLIASNSQIKRVQYSQAQEKAWREDKNTKLQEAMKSWASEHLGQSNACNIFGSLLKHSGYMEQALHCFQRFAEIAQAAGNRQGFANALNNISSIYQIRGEYNHVLQYLQAAAKIARELGDKKNLCSFLNNIGLTYQYQREYDRALQYCQESEKIAKELGDKSAMVSPLNNIGLVYEARGEYDRALQYYQEAEKIDRELGDKQCLATRLNNIGNIYYTRREYDRALQYYQEAEKIGRELGDKQCLATCLTNIGRIYYARREYDNALQYYHEAEKISRELGDKKGLVIDLNNIGLFYQVQGKHDRALQYYKESEKIERELGDQQGLATHLNNIGSIYKDRGEYDHALQYYLEAEKIVRELGDKKGLVRCLSNIGLIYDDRGDYARALQYFQEVEKIDRDLGDKKGLATHLGTIGIIYQSLGEYNNALQYFQEALQLQESIQDISNAAIMSQLLGILYEENLHQLPQAIVFYEKSLSYYRQLGNEDEIASLEKSIQRCRENAQ